MTKFRKICHAWKRTGPLSIFVLKFGLFLVALQAAILAIEAHHTFLLNPLLVPLYYPPLMEYIALPLALVVAASLLFAALEKERIDR